MEKLKSHISNFNFKQFFNKVLPLTKWLLDYNLSKLQGDVLAGITTGIMIIPQAIAFATLAGLPPQYGLYSALTPGITYCILGTSKDVSMGPTVTMALFTYRFNVTRNPVGASALAFFVGIILLSMYLLRLGFITKFMPSHVISGFVSAAAIVIAITQLKTLFGYRSDSSSFIDKVVDFFKLVKRTNPWDISLGVFSVLFLTFFLIMSRTVLKNKVDKKHGWFKNILFKVLNFFCVARSALICVIGTTVAYGFHAYGHTDSFTLAGELPSGLPEVNAPLGMISLANNNTITTADLLEGFGAALIVLPLIQYIQAISIAKAFGKMYKYDIGASQELLALGAANFIGSFFGGWPVTGSFSRSAVNAMSGTRTPFSGVLSCVIVIFAVSFLTPVFYYIPKTSLSAMIFMAVVTMVDIKVPIQIWRVNRIDLLPYLVTFLGTFYKLEVGVLAGGVVALLILVSNEVKPQYDTDIIDGNLALIKFHSTMSYPAVDSFKSRLTKIRKQYPDLQEIQIDMFAIQNIDYGVVNGFKNLIEDMKAENISIKFINFSKDKVKVCLSKAGVLDIVNFQTLEDVTSVSGETNNMQPHLKEDSIALHLKEKKSEKQTLISLSDKDDDQSVTDRVLHVTAC